MRKSKNEIIAELNQSFTSLYQAAKAVPDEAFNISKEGKWTPAENVRHLITATKMTRAAFALPKFLHVLLYGKPRRASHGYGKLVENYHHKLEAGAKASGVYVPKKDDYEKQRLANKLQLEGVKLTTAIANRWTEEQLDKYQVAHPILGLLTVRELAYFTIYHNGHHLETIKNYYLPV